MPEEILILETIYAFTDDLWEQCPLRLPPFAMFADYGITTEDIAELLTELQAEYDFPVTDYPECIQDVVDLVMQRPFTRLSKKQKTDIASEAYNFTPIRQQQSLISKIKNLMKKLFTLVTLLSLSIVSCERVSIPQNQSAQDSSTDTTTSGNVHISVSNITQTPMEAAMRSVPATRAAVSDYCKYLSFCVYDTSGKRLQQYNQTFGEEGYGSVNLSLDNGHYRLVILAYNGDGYATMTDINKTTFKNNTIGDTFWNYDEFDVKGSATLEEHLVRRVSMIRLVTTAAATEGTSRMKFYYTGGSSTLDCTTGLGSVNSRQTVYSAVKPGTNQQYDVYTFPHCDGGEQDTIKYQAQALDANGNIIHEMAVDELPIQMNYITTLTGQFFSKDGNTISITIDDTSAKWSTLNLNY